MNLQDLYTATNEVVKDAIKCKNDIDGDINWGNLSCTEAAKIENNYGEAHYRVTIQECNPDNIELWDFIYRKLWEKFPNIILEIQFDW